MSEVNRCVCNNLYFIDLIKIAIDKKMDLKELLKFTGAGSKCGMCIPYIEKEIDEAKKK